MRSLPDSINEELVKATNSQIWISQWFKWAGWLVVFAEIYLIIGLLPRSSSDVFSSMLILALAILPIYAVALTASGTAILICLLVARVDPSHLSGIDVRFRTGAFFASGLGLAFSMLTFRFLAIGVIGFLIPYYRWIGNIH